DALLRHPQRGCPCRAGRGIRLLVRGPRGRDPAAGARPRSAGAFEDRRALDRGEALLRGNAGAGSGWCLPVPALSIILRFRYDAGTLPSRIVGSSVPTGIAASLASPRHGEGRMSTMHQHRSRISRRSLLKGTAGAVAAGSAMSAALAQASTGSAGFYVNLNQDGGELNTYTWYEPWLDEILPMFEEETG